MNAPNRERLLRSFQFGYMLFFADHPEGVGPVITEGMKRVQVDFGGVQAFTATPSALVLKLHKVNVSPAARFEDITLLASRRRFPFAQFIGNYDAVSIWLGTVRDDSVEVIGILGFDRPVTEQERKQAGGQKIVRRLD